VAPPIFTLVVIVQLTIRWSMLIGGEDFPRRVRQSTTVQCQSSSARFVASPHTRSVSIVILQPTIYYAKKVPAFHTRYPVLGQELITV